MQLDSDVWAKLIDGIRNGLYGAFLGAGFSMSSRSSDDRSLPSASALAEELARHLGHDEGLAKQYGLKGISQLTTGNKDERLASFLTQRFYQCKPGTAPLLLPKQRWRCVYTLNVDDVVQSAYASCANRVQTAVSYTFQDNFQRQIDPQELQVVHLHGSVLSPDHGFVFAPSQYGRVIAADATWWKIAADEIATQPFIFVGCSLLEEDLEYYFQSREGFTSTSHPYPSLFVTRKLDPILMGQCDRYGLVPFESDADGFFEALDRRIGDAGGPRSPLTRSCTSDSRHARIFCRQWIRILRSELPQANAEVGRLATGLEPRWEHVEDNEVVLRTDTHELIARTSRWLEKPRLSLDLVRSPAGNGKTCVLMHAAMYLSEQVNVFWFAGQERLDVSAASTFLQELNEPCVLFVDDVADHVHQVHHLFNELGAGRGKCRLVGAYRQHADQLVVGTLGKFLLDSSSLQPLNPKEAGEIVSKARAAGTLGLSAQYSNAALATRLHGKPLLEGLLEIASPEPLVKRLVQEVGDFESGVRDFYTIAAIAHSLGSPLRGSIAIRAAMPSSGNIYAALRAGAGCINRRFIGPELYIATRHRVVAEWIVASLSAEVVFDTATRIAAALRPYANRIALKQKLPENRLAASLFNYKDFIEKYMPTFAVRFYDGLAESWQWNSRFWEQRALCMTALGDMQTALSYARHAVGTEQHPHTFTTLAKVLFLAAERDRYVNTGSLVDEGVSSCCEAIERGRTGPRIRIEVHPYDVGIRGLVKYINYCADEGMSLGGWRHWDLLRRFRREVGSRFSVALARDLADMADLAAARYSVSL